MENKKSFYDLTEEDKKEIMEKVNKELPIMKRKVLAEFKKIENRKK